MWLFLIQKEKRKRKRYRIRGEAALHYQEGSGEIQRDKTQDSQRDSTDA